MTQILLPVLLLICCCVFASSTSAQILLEVPDGEVANDLREFRTLRRVYVYSTPDLLSRNTIVKELSRERGLLEIVERPEDADFYLVFYSAGEGTNPFDAPMGGSGPASRTGTLIAYRQVQTCDGFRSRLLFITRKSQLVHAGIPVPLTTLNMGGLETMNQNGLGPRRFSKERLVVELGARGVLFLIGKKFRNAFRFDQVNSTLAVSFSSQPELQATREFIRQVKDARKGQRLLYSAAIVTSDWQVPFPPSFEPPPITRPEQSSASLPCLVKSNRGPGSTYGSAYSVDDGLRPGLPQVAQPAGRPRRVNPVAAVASPE